MIYPNPNMDTRYNDERGRVLPWWTRPALEWMLKTPSGGPHKSAAEVLERLIVLEWGAGYSTVWFAENCRGITAIEHDARWRGGPMNAVTNEPNCLVWHVEVPGLPEGVSREFETSREWCNRYVLKAWSVNPRPDLVVVDGLYRHACAELGALLLVPGGTLVFDNADWPEFADAPDLIGHHFRERMRFTEPGHEWATDVYVGKVAR